MFIHSYFTDGFYPWAKLLIESYGFHNGHDTPIKLDAINITDEQADELHNVYKNLELFRKTLDLKQIAKEYSFNLDNLLKQKKQVETQCFTKDSNNWKQLIADDFRIEATLDMLNRFPEEEMLHFDIDTYVRDNIDFLKQLVTDNDICVRFRLNSKKENRKVLIAVQSYKHNVIVMEFFDRWLKRIKSKKLSDRPIGWGQQAYYMTYLEFKNRCKWGNIPEKFYAPKHLQEHKIWGGNGLDGKTIILKNYRKDMEKISKYKKENINK